MFSLILCIIFVLLLNNSVFENFENQLISFFVFRKLPIQEFHFSRVLQDIGLTNEQVRFCLFVFFTLREVQNCHFSSMVK